MGRNYTGKGNAEWQELAKPRPPEKVKLRLTPIDVYQQRVGICGPREGRAGRAHGPSKDSTNN